jgi:hypothetical protein
MLLILKEACILRPTVSKLPDSCVAVFYPDPLDINFGSLAGCKFPLMLRKKNLCNTQVFAIVFSIKIKSNPPLRKLERTYVAGEHFEKTAYRWPRSREPDSISSEW